MLSLVGWILVVSGYGFGLVWLKRILAENSLCQFIRHSAGVSVKLNDLPQSKAIDIIFCDGIGVVIGQPEQAAYMPPHGILFDTMYEIEFPIEDEFGSLCCEIF